MTPKHAESPRVRTFATAIGAKQPEKEPGNG